MPEKKKMRLGKIVFDMGYVVDLDNPEMIEHAQECIYEDIMNAVKYDEISSWMEIIDAPDANEGDIPEFLLDEEDLDDEDEDESFEEEIEGDAELDID